MRGTGTGRRGLAAALGLTTRRVAALGRSRPLVKRIGAWPSVVTVTVVTLAAGPVARFGGPQRSSSLQPCRLFWSIPRCLSRWDAGLCVREHPLTSGKGAGSPKWGGTLVSKPVVAQTLSPVRMRTSSSAAWDIPVGSLDIEAERGLPVGPGRYEASPAARAEPGGGEEPGGQVAAVVFHRKRWHGQPDVLGEQGDDGGDDFDA